MTTFSRIAFLLATMLVSCGIGAQTPLEGTPIQRRSDLPFDKGFVSRGDSVTLLLNALAAEMKKPVIVSAKAQKKHVTGSFDLGRPVEILDKLAGEIGLIWVSDGQSLYVYDASEMRSTVVHMRNATISSLIDFLRKTELSDPRYPVRGDPGEGTFYLSAPPIYVDIVTNAAGYLDSLYKDVDLDSQRIEVIKLDNSFVNGRRYDLRGTLVSLPGVAQIIQDVLRQSGAAVSAVPAPLPADPSTASLPSSAVAANESTMAPRATEGAPALTDTAVVLAYPETNSLLVRGTFAQVQLIKKLIAQLDVPRRQIELSLWIIDVRKDDLDALGVDWTGAVGIGNKFGVGLNQQATLSTLDGARFLASISALSKQGNASIISRPIVLTQENVPAIFDNNTTFYTRLIGERNVQLDSVTYGTLISVLPRISHTNDVEMQLNIEDGNATQSGAQSLVDGLPIVGRTKIDTVARVPHDLSLLVGGYTRDQKDVGEARIPGLSRIPWIGKIFRHRSRRNDRVARVFLIQPRVIGAADAMDRPTVRDRFVPEAGYSIEDAMQALKRGDGASRNE